MTTVDLECRFILVTNFEKEDLSEVIIAVVDIIKCAFSIIACPCKTHVICWSVDIRTCCLGAVMGV